jgi:hypothetical protein
LTPTGVTLQTLGVVIQTALKAAVASETEVQYGG